MSTIDVVPIKPIKPLPQTIIYPESDGRPMADNTKQFHQIVTIEGNLEILYAEDENVFVAGDLLWYPVEGNNKIRSAPDVMVAFGRPKGDRRSYLQWKEENIAPQVVFEILSPGNTKAEMERKFGFYERYGVEEYYLYDPDSGRLEGWLRNSQGVLEAIPNMDSWRSPRLDIRFELDGIELQLYYPDGQRFLTFTELDRRRREAEVRANEAEVRADEAEARAQAESDARMEAEARAQEYAELLKKAGLL